MMTTKTDVIDGSFLREIPDIVTRYPATTPLMVSKRTG